MTNEHEQSALRNEKGFTLAEMIVVTAIFVIVMIITAKAFDRLLSTGSQQSKSSASSIEGIVGLEMMRRDLSHAGYGLPWSVQTAPATSPFPEVSATPADSLGVTPSSLNETIPHPLLCVTAGSSSTNPGTDYLVIKSAMLPLTSTNSAVGRWGYLNYTMSGSTPASYIQRVNDPTSDVRSGTDRVITIDASVSADGKQKRQLLNSAASFFYTPPDNYVAPASFQATNKNDSYIVYAIADRDLQMPWNRADYYVNRPAPGDPNFKIPLSCNPGTGILFKAVADHSGGYVKPYPLLNCVLDMKVVYTLDPNNDGNLSYAPAASSLLSPDDLRSQLRNVTVYVLAQEGKKDPTYTYPGNSLFVGPTLGTTPLVSVGKVWQKTELDQRYPGWQNYRWKLYAIPVTPKNMQN